MKINQAKKKERISKNSNEKKSFNVSENNFYFVFEKNAWLEFFCYFLGYIQINLMITGE